MSMKNEELTVEVYIRPDQMTEPVDSKIRSLDQIQSADNIDDFSIHSWPDKITLSERTPYSNTIEMFKKMEAWAKEHRFSIQPPFIVQTTTSHLLNETRTTIRTPVMCLAVYAGDQLANVFPHSREEDQYSVTDAIADLKEDEIELFESFSGPFGPPPDRCSACGTWLMNVQGMGICQDCDRIELGTTQSKQNQPTSFSP